MTYGLKSTQEQLADIHAEADSGVTLTHVDTCLPCYVQDHHNRDGECLFGVHVDGSSTVADVREGLETEIRASGDRVPDYVTDEQIASAVTALFEGVDPARDFDRSLPIPETDDDIDADELCQAWFVLTFDPYPFGQCPDDGNGLSEDGICGYCGNAPAPDLILMTDGRLGTWEEAMRFIPEGGESTY